MSFLDNVLKASKGLDNSGVKWYRNDYFVYVLAFLLALGVYLLFR